jgi:4-amino-4-deoxy-L-arabinose transferase-like glycosyltransferase
MDEQNHLARGLAFLRTGDARFSLEHPPLVNSLSALPLLTLPDIRLPTDHPSWQAPEGWYAFAEQLLWVYNDDVERMVFLARLPIVFLALGLGLIGYRFGRQLWGRAGALIVLIFLLFDPNLLAHGRYSTTDAGGAVFLFLAAYLLWRLWSKPAWHWGYLAAAGLGLGLALGSKLSNLVFIPVFALLAIVPLYGGRWTWRDSGRRAVQYGSAFLISWIVLWALYAFEWGAFRFQTEGLTSLNQWAGPLPTFLAGVEQILRVSGGGRMAFLLGEFSADGWWYYFPVAFGVKTPLAVILLFLLAAILLLVYRATRGRALFLVTPALAFLLVSMQSGLNIGYRHLLPMLPFLYTMAAGVTVLPGLASRPVRPVEHVSRIVLYGALLSVLIIDVLLHPHYLSYFNLAAGGPANGHQVLVDSNIDWGQDLKRLDAWMSENSEDRIKLAWFGTADPAYYGIDYDPLPGLTHHFDLWWDVPFDTAKPEPGVYAISVSNLWELPLADKTVFAAFREREPDDRVGYSILIYRVQGNG